MIPKIRPRNPHNSLLQRLQSRESAASAAADLSHESHCGSFAVHESGCGLSEQQLKKAWHRLSQDQRELLGLYVVEGLTCRQIAERKQQSHATVRQALVQLYARLLLQVDSGQYDSQLERF